MLPQMKEKCLIEFVIYHILYRMVEPWAIKLCTVFLLKMCDGCEGPQTALVKCLWTNIENTVLILDS